MTDFMFRGKEYHVVFVRNWILLHPSREQRGQATVTCYISSPSYTVADVTIRNPSDESNEGKARKISFERAARRLATHLWKKGGPRPHNIKNAILSAYNDAVLHENNPDLWAEVQVKKAQQKKVNDEKRAELKEKNRLLKEEKKQKYWRKQWEERMRVDEDDPEM